MTTSNTRLDISESIATLTVDRPSVKNALNLETVNEMHAALDALAVNAEAGVLIITGEYSTGMIRSTFAAVPRRLPALVGKVLVFGVFSFLVALASLVLTALVVVPILAANELSVEVADPDVWRGILGTAGFIALIGLMALGIGAIVRNTAGAIAAPASNVMPSNRFGSTMRSVTFALSPGARLRVAFWMEGF
mgnify:CR=1 FL=1